MAEEAKSADERAKQKEAIKELKSSLRAHRLQYHKGKLFWGGIIAVPVLVLIVAAVILGLPALHTTITCYIAGNARVYEISWMPALLPNECDVKLTLLSGDLYLETKQFSSRVQIQPTGTDLRKHPMPVYIKGSGTVRIDFK
ncbi:hypothetical protein [Rhodoplanes sp. Z2-YC6860]|uniref:hypothetical protein n=1 Tax=Rhodoplanes sp. Z2-YC6860 TaxID=674703 RepID=UPI00082E0425|nr:hypothetical protein [Rhodoplanes sp. Z2-YC6860]